MPKAMKKTGSSDNKHTRGSARLERVMKGIHRWTWYSEDKGMDFNGYAVELSEGLALIDPVEASEPILKAIQEIGRPNLIFLTNKDHERAAFSLRERYGAAIHCHREEAPLLSGKPEQSFGDGAVLPGGVETTRLRGLKSPAECAFLLPSKKALFVGDAVCGNPKGSLGLVKKHRGSAGILDAIRPLAALDFDALLVGDGEPFVSGGKKALENFLNREGAA